MHFKFPPLNTTDDIHIDNVPYNEVPANILVWETYLYTTVGRFPPMTTIAGYTLEVWITRGRYANIKLLDPTGEIVFNHTSNKGYTSLELNMERYLQFLKEVKEI